MAVINARRLSVVCLIAAAVALPAAALGEGNGETAKAAVAIDVFDPPLAQGKAAAVVVRGAAGTRCRLTASRLRTDLEQRLRFDLAGDVSTLSWKNRRSAMRGKWELRVACGAAESATIVRVKGRNAGAGALVARRSFEVSGGKDPEQEGGHEELPAQPPGEDPATWSDVPGEGAGGAEPRFALPFRCGEVWSGATYGGHGRGNDYPVDLNHANGSYEVTAPVVASDGGVIRVSQGGYNGGYGEYVVIDHGGGWTSLYAHLSRRTVTSGIVQRGDQIGVVGTTGASSGPHLHFEQRFAGALQHVRFDGRLIQYSYSYPGVPMRSGNCGNPAGQTALPVRLGVINGCGGLFTKEGGTLEAPYVRQLGCADAKAIEMSGNRIAAINGCGAAYLKDGAQTATWVKESECGDARAVAVTPSRFALINSCGALYTKEGPATAPYVPQLGCGDARAVEMAGNRIAAINGCGAAFLKDGAQGASWVQMTQCGDARAVAVTPNRFAVINGCGALYTKEGPANAPYVQQLGCGDAKAVEMSGNRIAAITGCSAAYLKDGPQSASWVRMTQCHDAAEVDVTQSLFSVINGCRALFTKQGPAGAGYVRQLACNDAGSAALAGP